MFTKFEILNIGYTQTNPQFPFSSPAGAHVTLCGTLLPADSIRCPQLNQLLQDPKKESKIIFFPDGMSSSALVAQETSCCLLVMSYIGSKHVARADSRESSMKEDAILVDVALVLGRSPKVAGTYERLDLAVSWIRLPQGEFRYPLF